MIIAHDLGTTGNKASLHSVDGTLLDSVTVAYPAHFAPGGIAEQDPHDWWQAVVEATRKLVARTATDPASVLGIVVSGQMMGAVLLDENYRPVRPAIIWADTRASHQQRQLSDKIGDAAAYAILGHRLNPTYSVSKVMWVRDNEPDVWQKVRHVCVAKDYIAYQLSGRLATDRSDASGMNAYDQQTGTWSEAIMEAAGLDVQLFPDIVESTTLLGTLTQSAADALGLMPHTSVVMGGGDGPLAAVGAGVVSPDDGAYVSLGTSSWISFATLEPVLDPSMQTFTFNNVVPGGFVPTATMQAGGASLQWIAEVLEPDGSARDMEKLFDGAENQPSTDDPYFLPYLLGERSPLWEPSARGAFVGLGRHHTHSHMARAAMEGVAFNLWTCIRAFESAGHRFEHIDAVGGGAVSDVFLQLLADVWGMKVFRRSVTEEANSLGAAVTAAVALGTADFSVARQLSQVTAEFVPDSSKHDMYTSRYPVFVDAVDALLPWFRGKQR
jgi:xylulokinase